MPVSAPSFAWLAVCVLLVSSTGACGHGKDRIHAVVGTSHDGWIVFGREFQLYEKKDDIGRKYDRTCYGGIFDTLRRHRSAARFDGHHVRIVGTLVSTKEYFGETGLAVRAENYCARDQILVAHSIRPMP